MSNFTFAHLADCHLGGWRDPRMRQVGLDSFKHAIDIALERKVDFIIVAGDLFNTALPSFDVLREVVAKFQEVKKTGTPVYYIAGSHDYSPAGKTMLHVLQEAELAKDVLSGHMNEHTNKLELDFIVDEKTGAKLCGILGRSQSLEKTHYELLDHESIIYENGFKIFVFHTTINELKPKELEDVAAIQMSLLPKNFQYYAGGHVHIRLNEVIPEFGRIVYPGPTYPNNFLEIEKLETGSFVINTVTDNEITNSEFVLLEEKPVISKTLDCNQKSPEQINTELNEWCDTIDCVDAIITLRLRGTLIEGATSDLNLRELEDKLNHKGAYMVMKNTTALVQNQFIENIIELESHDDIEAKVLAEHLDDEKQVNAKSAKKLTVELMQRLDDLKRDGETVTDYEARVKENVLSELDLD